GLAALEGEAGFISAFRDMFVWRETAWSTIVGYGAVAAAVVLLQITAVLSFNSFVIGTMLVVTTYLSYKGSVDKTDASNRYMEQMADLHLRTIEALAIAVDAKDEVTHDHVFRVQVYATGLARHFGLSASEVEALKAGAILHDIGKLAVPDYILNKPGKLTPAEFDEMKMHTVVGAEILERVSFPYPVVPVVRHHHERWDGRGYPDGLAGDEIPMTARIISVVDCFDAVREDRQYRKGMTREEACQFLRTNAGTQFDPRVVEEFLENLAQYEQEIAAHKHGQQPILTPTTQAGLSESALSAVPAAGLAQSSDEAPDYIKQITAAHSEVAALYEMAQTFNTSLNVSDVVKLTVDRIETLCGFTTCAIYLRQKEDDSAVAAYVFGENADRIRGRSLAAGHGIAGWVVINNRAMTNTDPMLDLANFLDDNRTGYRTVAVFPLANGADSIGALALYSSKLDSYSTDQLHLIESVSRLASTALQNAFLNEQTTTSAQIDALTGLPNGRALYAQFDQELAAAKAQGQPLTLLSLNISGMRAVNREFGYRSGDQVIGQVARVLLREIGESRVLSRIAGDEFVCLLSGADATDAASLGERVSAAISRLSLEVKQGQAARVGLSYGAAGYPAAGLTLDELLNAAKADSSNRANRQEPLPFSALDAPSNPYCQLA
ncbi:MAG TPA: HD domain-containing phosphohydrolase, partial [Blastocatellia bacterium]|nr:HD domain-containing phosphohydrolase [Blastocatellia bacterium]